jgi:hypothetical protein
MRLGKSLLPALALTLAQVSFVLLFSKGPGFDLGQRYLQLNNWDSFHYLVIAEKGYDLPDPNPSPADVHNDVARVAFFPAVPFLTRAVSSITGAGPNLSILWVAQASTWLFWCYVFELLFQWGYSRRQAYLVAGLIAAHPAAFSMVLGYTESVFSLGVIGMIYWCEQWLASPRRYWGAWALAAIHGALMSGSRIVGIPLAAYPVVRRALALKPVPLGTNVAAWALAGAASLGGLGFFAYCQLRFGQWDIYIRLQQIGWGNYPDYLAVVNPLSYLPRFFFEHTVESISRAAVPFTAALFYLAWRLEELPSPKWRKRAGIYFVAFMITYIPLAGKANAKMDSMIRYTFPSFVLLMLAYAQIGRERGIERAWARLPRSWRVALAGGTCLAVATQGWLAYRFLRGLWSV